METIENKIFISEQDIINIIDGIFKRTSKNLDNGENEYDYLNINWYAKKLRLAESKNYIETLRAKEGAINKAYGLCEITQDIHLQNVDVDYSNLDAEFTCLVQTHKLNVLEDLLVRTNLSLIGVKFPIEVVRKNETGDILSSINRNGNIVFSRLQTQEIRTESAFGETAVVSFSVSFLIFDNLSVYSDYELSISTDDKTYTAIPFTFFKISFDTVQRALPNTNLAETGVLNNTSGMTFCFSAYDKKDDLGVLLERLLFYHQIFKSVQVPKEDKYPMEPVGDAYPTEPAPKNNDVYYLRINSPNELTYKYRCVVLNASREIQNTLVPTQTTITIKPIAVI